MPLLVFSVILFVALLISGRAERSVLSTSVLFLLAGALAGNGGLGLIQLQPGSPVVKEFVEIALFSVLFTDGMRISADDLKGVWRLPGRALLFGFPLTMLMTGALAFLLLGFDWSLALLIGAALSPTDPVFASALVGRQDVPARLRHLLNIESGLNDGLALPIVVLLIGAVSTEDSGVLSLTLEIAGGIVLGIVMPWAAVRLESLKIFGAAPLYQPILGFAVGLLLLSVAGLSRANQFLAAFAGGITLSHVAPDTKRAFHQMGELTAEFFKLAALMVFGSLITPEFFRHIGGAGVIFVILALVLVRPLALAVSLAGEGLSRREWLAAAWFGPRGFATVFFSLLILQAGVPDRERIYHLLAVVVAASIVAHSSTDVAVAHWFRRNRQVPRKTI